MKISCLYSSPTTFVTVGLVVTLITVNLALKKLTKCSVKYLNLVVAFRQMLWIGKCEFKMNNAGRFLRDSQYTISGFKYININYLTSQIFPWSFHKSLALSLSFFKSWYLVGTLFFCAQQSTSPDSLCWWSITTCKVRADDGLHAKCPDEDSRYRLVQGRKPYWVL